MSESDSQSLLSLTEQDPCSEVACVFVERGLDAYCSILMGLVDKSTFSSSIYSEVCYTFWGCTYVSIGAILGTYLKFSGVLNVANSTYDSSVM